ARGTYLPRARPFVSPTHTPFSADEREGLEGQPVELRPEGESDQEQHAEHDGLDLALPETSENVAAKWIPRIA
ncbi:hypothetical protein ACFQ8O_03595, partial [Streptomyces coelicoflavus]|uniref:hypothetical protein n=1 Tax=Streptomyces coelicoflavus TaxID=285562 RepID=UPI0036B24737